MKIRKSTLLQTIVVSMLSLVTQADTSTPPGSLVPAQAQAHVDSVAVIRPLEVRIRRLHMVRPDLLHYPIQYDTYC